MSFLSWVGRLAAVGVAVTLGVVSAPIGALILASAFLNEWRRIGGTPEASDQSRQRDVVLDPQAAIPVVYGRAIVAPKLAFIGTDITNKKLYVVGVLSEGVIADIEEIYLDGNCAVQTDGTVRHQASETALTVTAVDLTTPARLHATAHGLVTGDTVRISAGSLAGEYLVTVEDADHFTVPDTSTTTSAGSARRLNPGYWSLDEDGDETSTALVRFAKYLGTDGQTAAANAGEANGPTAASTMAVHDVPGWGTAALAGLAYLVLEITYDAARFPNGIPAVTAMVKGRTVYDPRSASTAWSDNPILCFRDYLSDGARYGASDKAVRYGVGIPAADIFDGASDAEGLRLLATYCDGTVSVPAGTGLIAVSSTANAGELITTGRAHYLSPGDTVWVRGVTATPALADGEYTVATTPAADTLTLTGITFSGDNGAGGTIQKVTTQARYACNGALDTARTLQENLNAILSSCRGYAVQSGGLWSAIITRAGLTPSSFTLDPTSIVGEWELSLPPADEVPNLITARYAPRLGDTATVEWPPTTLTNPYLEDDGYVPCVKEIELPMTQDYYQAQRIARCVLEEARGKLFVGLTAHEGALALTVGDLVPVTHPTPAWTAKSFWITTMGLLPDGLIRLVLMQDVEAAYDEELTDDAPGAGCALPLPWYVAPPTDPVSGSLLSTGTTDPRILVRWTPSTDPLVSRYEIWAKRTLPAALADANFRSYGIVGADHDSAFIGTVESGETWAVRVRALRAVGTASAWLTGTHACVILGAATCTVTREVAPTSVTYHITFGTFCSRVDLFTIEHAAASGANPPQDLAHRAYAIEGVPGDVKTVSVPTTADYYRRSFTVAYDRSGVQGATSAVVEDQAHTASSGPSGPPSGLTQSTTTSESIVITWTNGDATALTRVWVNGVCWKADVAAGTATATITDLVAGQTIQVKLDHFKNGQASAFCSTVAMTSSSLAAGPTSFAVTAYESVVYGKKTYGRYTVAWSGGADPDGPWEILEAVTNDSSVASVFASGSSGTSASLERLASSGSFYYWIRYTGTLSALVALADNPLDYAGI